MSSIVLKNENPNDITILSNLFIDEYMMDCNESQLKIYLYLLRCMSAGITTSVSNLADRFNHAERDVIRALRFLEERHLLSLGYDQSGSLCSMSIINPERTAPVLSFVTSTGSLRAVTPAPRSIQDVNGKEDAMEPTNNQRPERPVYSLDQLRTFKETEACSQLLFLSETYLGKTLSGNDIQILCYIHNDLGFDVDLMDYLLQYCAEKGKKDYRYIEHVALTWYDTKIRTPKQAATYVRNHEKVVTAVLKAFGRSNSLTPAESDFIHTWMHVYKMSADVISEACNRTALATDRNRFAYANSILKAWSDAGLHSLDAIAAQDAAFRSKRESSGRSTTSGKTASAVPHTAFGTFEQHDYDFAAIEQALLSN